MEERNLGEALLRLLTVTSEPETGTEFPGEDLFGPVLGNRKPLVEALMKSGVNFIATNDNQETALHLASKNDHANSSRANSLVDQGEI